MDGAALCQTIIILIITLQIENVNYFFAVLTAEQNDG